MSFTLHKTPSKTDTAPPAARVVAAADGGEAAGPALNQDELDLARAGHVGQLSRKLGFWVSSVQYFRRHDLATDGVF